MLNTIKLNTKNDLVKVAKYLTIYSPICGATNIFDVDFENFIKNFQTEHNLEVDGIIGKNTWTAITNGLPLCSTSKNRISIYTCAIQILLGGLEVDGIYGNKTKNAVAAYQSSSGFEVDGICGPQTWNGLIIASTVPADGSSVTPANNDKVINQCVKYLQWDNRWGNIRYSTHTNAQTIGNSGCGPTSMAMIMATFVDNNITPVEMCDLAIKGGYRTYDSGTAWAFYKYVFQQYDKFEKYIETSSVSTLQAALREGALAVCSMNANDNGFWTTGGCSKMAS